MPSRQRPKKYLYLSPPRPDRDIVHRSVTRIIPPPQPEIVEPPEPEPEPEPPLILPPPPRSPSPPPCPPVEEIPIEVISVDVDTSSHRHRKKKKSRSRSKSNTRSSHDKEVLIERDRYIPYPVRAEPQYDTYRYVEAPRRYVQPEPERKMITQDEETNERIHIDISDRRRSRDYYRR